ncbi:hypothetical protein V2G26_005183 [Clonostachys chloroleuca]
MPTIMLNGPYDWDAFEQAVIITAAAERVLYLIQLEDTDEFPTLRRKLPTMPEYSQYRAKVSIADQTSKMGFVRREQPAKSYNDLLDEDKDVLKFELASYRTLLSEFNTEADGIRNMLTWIRAQELYLEALTEAENSNKKTDWEKWITNWEQAITIARLRKVAAACGPEWFKDLERHLDSRHLRTGCIQHSVQGRDPNEKVTKSKKEDSEEEDEAQTDE